MAANIDVAVVGVPAKAVTASGCEFRRNPARDSDLMSATVPI
jgi:hypothetical protein